jgi:MFS family permease
MYQVDRTVEAGGVRVTARAPARSWRVAPNVWFLGVTSLLTDVSSEMVTSVLPMYLVLHLGMTPLAFGVIDGLYHGVSSILRIASGFLADRWRRYKELAAAGYALSAICKLGLLAAGDRGAALAAIVALDRTGKGIRTSPRDALISMSTPRASLGEAFGVHRAMDAVGATAGPLVAFLVLARIPGGYDAVFVASFAFAIAGLGALLLFVDNRPALDPAERHEPAGRTAWVDFRSSLGVILATPRVRRLAAIATALALTTVSDGFIYLTLQRRLNLGTGFFPLLFVATSACYFLLAAPAGRAADRMGRTRMLLAGYGALCAAYAVLLAPWTGWAGALPIVVLLGAFYAATDGVLMALASACVPVDRRAAGLGVLTTLTNIARLAGSIVFGLIWTWWGVEAALVAFAVGLAASVATGARILLEDVDRLERPT